MPGPRRGRKTRPKAKPSRPRGKAGSPGSSIEQHPLFPEILEMLKMHWAPATIVQTLGWQYASHLEGGPTGLPPLPAARTIHRWRDEHLSAHDVLPPRLIERKLDQIPTKVDAYRTTELAVVHAENRFAEAREVEEKMGGVPMVQVDRCAETLMKLIELLWRIGQDLGLNPRLGEQPMQVAVLVGGVGGQMSGELDRGAMLAAVAAIVKHRSNRPVPQLDAEGNILPPEDESIEAEARDVTDETPA